MNAANPKSNLTRQITGGVAVSALTAVMLILAFHPYNLWFLSFIALVPMVIAQHFIFPVKWSGLASAIGIGGWLFVFLGAMFGGNSAGRVIQGVVVVIILIQIFTVPGVRRFHMQTGYRWFVPHGIADWVGIEMIRSFIPPINTHAFLAQTLYTRPWMLQPISIFGVYGLGVLITLVNFSLARILLTSLERRLRPGGEPLFESRLSFRWLITAGVVLLAWVGISLAVLSGAPANPPAVRAAAVQHNFPRPGHQDTPESQIERLRVLSEQARTAARQGAELIVMPELGLGVDPRVDFTAEWKDLAAETNAYLLIGYGVDDPQGWRNEAVLLTPGGIFMDTYGKNHPTTPGEPPIITSGVYPVYQTAFGPVGTIICNDVNYTNSARLLVRNGARLITVPTLETPGIALEMVAQSVLRAVENRVAVVKSDGAYSSAIIDPYGRILALRNASPDGADFALVSDVSLGTGSTITIKLWDWVGWLNLAGFVFFIVLQARARRQAHEPGSP